MPSKFGKTLKAITDMEMQAKTGSFIIFLGLLTACFGLMNYMKLRNDAANIVIKTDKEGRLIKNPARHKRLETVDLRVSHIVMGIGALFTVSGFFRMVRPSKDKEHEVLKFFRFSECAGSYQVQLLVGVILLLGATNIVLDKALDKAVVLRITKEIALCILGCLVMRYGLFVRMDKLNSKVA